MAKQLPQHLSVSSSDGSLYDTRDPNWSRNPPLRAVYNGGQREIDNCQQLKAALRYGQYAWPGGYPLYFLTSDGAALSFDAVRSELAQVLQSIQNRSNDGWRVVGCEINYEDNELYCDHSGERIESAHGDDDSGD